MRPSSSSAQLSIDAFCCDPSYQGQTSGTERPEDNPSENLCKSAVPDIHSNYSNTHVNSQTFDCHNTLGPKTNYPLSDFPNEDRGHNKTISNMEKLSEHESESESITRSESPFSCEECPDFSDECPDDCFAECPEDCANACLEVCPKECPDECPEECPDDCSEGCPEIRPEVCPEICPKVCTDNSCDIDIDNYGRCYEDSKDLPSYHCHDLLDRPPSKIDSFESLFYCHWGDDCDSFQFTSQQELDSHLRVHLEAQIPKTKSISLNSNDTTASSKNLSSFTADIKQPVTKLSGLVQDANTCSPEFINRKIQLGDATDLSSQYTLNDGKAADEAFASGFQSHGYGTESSQTSSSLKAVPHFKPEPVIKPTSSLKVSQQIPPNETITDTPSGDFLSCQWDSCSLTAKEIDDILEHVRSEHLAQGIKTHHLCEEHDLDRCQHDSIIEETGTLSSFCGHKPHVHSVIPSSDVTSSQYAHSHCQHCPPNNSQSHFCSLVNHHHHHHHHHHQQYSQPSNESSYNQNFSYVNPDSVSRGYSQVPPPKVDIFHACCASHVLSAHASKDKSVQGDHFHPLSFQLPTPAHTPTHPQLSTNNNSSYDISSCGFSSCLPTDFNSNSGADIESSSEFLPCEWSDCDFSTLSPHELDLHISQLHEQQNESLSSNSEHQQTHISCQNIDNYDQQIHNHSQHNDNQHIHTNSQLSHSQPPSNQNQHYHGSNGEYYPTHHSHNHSHQTCYNHHNSPPPPHHHHHHHHHHSNKDLDVSILPKQNNRECCGPSMLPKDVKLTYVCRWTNNDHECSLQFDSCEDLSTHIINDHIGSRKSRYVCDWKGCNRNCRPFTQRQKIVRHLLTHTKFRPFTCHECGATFGEESVLKQHLRIHSGEKPFNCNICGKSFAANTALSIHLRTHTGEKPLRCKRPGCNKRFSESSNLAKHMKTHENEKRHTCDFSGCGKKFRRHGQLERHASLHVRYPGIKSEDTKKPTVVL
ncbi:hypothetical protein NADFUDRAFT_83914 [Nadsonia fulvescens var. elongata DSM 6958]|uniref:C2H2-type domain-containing protein n=1 Tax=Nadsonia fulvescens var. elongata DSM 6958 TaxID=857566 RepID=A0A1E3PEF1_9ASCO|nr:hypothetical protein NADFUDRAFT_83914 [Nadsonia fulvescens var. elongata DSM 6958]